MNPPGYSNKENPWEILNKNAYNGKVALIFHLKILEDKAYKKWLDNSKDKFGSRRMYRVKADPCSREGMQIDEHQSPELALEFMSTFVQELKNICSTFAVLAIRPEKSLTFRFTRKQSESVE